MKIEVTQDDIDKGERGSACMCPVARAIMRATETIPIVRYERISIFPSKWTPSPPEVVEFVFAFDNERPVQPFTFELDIPE